MIAMRAIVLRGLDTVAAYYRMFSSDNTWSGSILVEPSKISVEPIPSFEALLQLLRNALVRGESRILLACHGNPHGLPIPLVRGTSVTANADLLTELARAAGGDDDTRAQLLRYTAQGSTRRIFQSASDLDRLLQLLRDVRQRRIEHLEFRACNIGAGPALEAIHTCLNCRHTVAPTVFFAWANVATAGISRPSSQALLSRSPMPRRVFSRSDCFIAPPGTNAADAAVVMSSQAGPTGRPATLTLNALGADAILGWTQNYLEGSIYFFTGQRPPGGGYQRRGRLPLLGLWDSQSSSLLFPGDSFAYCEKLAVQNTP